MEEKQVLYVKLSSSAAVREKVIRLGEVAELACIPEKNKGRWEKLVLAEAEPGKKKRYVWSALDILAKIRQAEESVEVHLLGAEDVVVDCRRTPDKSSLGCRLKTAAVCVVTFVGGAFAIMTFNNDVDVGKIFGEIYQQIMGVPSNGRTVLEGAYSLGLFLGIVVFFNHLAGWKLTEDPTPLEVQMRQYEKDVAEAIVEYAGERQSSPQSERGADGT